MKCFKMRFTWKEKQQKISLIFIILYNPLGLLFFYKSLEHVVIVYTYCSLKLCTQKVLSTETDILNKAGLMPIKDLTFYHNSLSSIKSLSINIVSIGWWTYFRNQFHTTTMRMYYFIKTIRHEMVYSMTLDKGLYLTIFTIFLAYSFIAKRYETKIYSFSCESRMSNLLVLH